MFALFLAAAIAFGNPLKVLDNYQCNEPIHPEWAPVTDTFGSVAYEDPHSRYLLGKVDSTLIAPTPWGTVSVVAFIVDKNENRWKRNHARRIWNWVNKKYGPPEKSDEPLYIWRFTSGSSIVMGTIGNGFAVAFGCPPVSTM